MTIPPIPATDIGRQLGLKGTWTLENTSSPRSGDYVARAMGIHGTRTLDTEIRISAMELRECRGSPSRLLGALEREMRKLDSKLTRPYRPSRFAPARNRTPRLYP